MAARSVTEKRGGGNGPVGEHGETDRVGSRVDRVVAVQSDDGDREVSNVKFSSNMAANVVCGVRDRRRMAERWQAIIMDEARQGAEAGMFSGWPRWCGCRVG